MLKFRAWDLYGRVRTTIYLFYFLYLQTTIDWQEELLKLKEEMERLQNEVSHFDFYLKIHTTYKCPVI